jgi:hypothetical protein
MKNLSHSPPLDLRFAPGCPPDDVTPLTVHDDRGKLVRIVRDLGAQVALPETSEAITKILLLDISQMLEYFCSFNSATSDPRLIKVPVTFAPDPLSMFLSV